MSTLSDVMRLTNPWWEDQQMSDKLALPYKRKVFDKVHNLRKYRQMIILTGLRRVGKTTILYQVIQTLLKEIESKKILYFNFDKEVADILSIFEEYSSLAGIDYRKEKIIVCFDEITKLNKWANQLKLVYDANPNIKIYLSSSSSVLLEEDAIKNLGGRYFLISINPLSFREFLELSGKKNLLEHHKLHEQALKRECAGYMLRNFPETITWENELVIKDYLKTTIIDKIIKSDLAERFKNLNKDLLYTLIELFYKDPGMYLDYDNLSKSLRISKNTLYKHIFYLEFCYLITIVKNYRPSTLATTRKLQRAYPYWWTMAYCYGENKDKMMEAIVINSIGGKHYWRDLNKEIDVLQITGKKIMPIEVKQKEKLDDRDIMTLKFFMQKYKVKEGKLVYLGKEDTKHFEGKKIEIVPLWKFLLEQE
ncbi:ATP-binding protein [Candidatus Woesearchaeota archaeon]|nr:ATP-binding protein [Candidatus Woesearchaeota archaeon]